MNRCYPAQIERDGDYLVISFRDVPEALCQIHRNDAGHLEEEARMALGIAFDYYFQHGMPIPEASPALLGDRAINLSPELIERIDKHNKTISFT